jgi:Kef-type K+ transport system membrane component KefB
VADTSSPEPLVVVAGAAVIAPLIADRLRRWRVPVVLFELILGIVIGPDVLDVVEIDPLLDDLSSIGLAFLMLLAGYEVDLERMKGAPLKLASTAWAASLVLGLAVGFVLMEEGFVRSELLVGLALTTTALGVLLPMLSDRGLLHTDLGRHALAAGTLGEFGPIVAIALLLSGENPAKEALLLVAFVLVALAAAWFTTRPTPPALLATIQRHVHTSAQLPVRIAVFLLALMLLLAFELGLDTILGAFTAGVILRMLRNEEQAESLDPKLEALGFGFFIPVFFIVTGMRFDLAGLLDDTSTMLRVPIFLVLFLVVRGVPALLVYRRVLAPRARAGFAVLQSTALPLVVVITTIGLELDKMTTQNATALVGAAMLSVLVFPLLGFALLPAETSPSPGEQPEAAAIEERGIDSGL